MTLRSFLNVLPMSALLLCAACADMPGSSRTASAPVAGNTVAASESVQGVVPAAEPELDAVAEAQPVASVEATSASATPLVSTADASDSSGPVPAPVVAARSLPVMPSVAPAAAPPQQQQKAWQQSVDILCEQIGNKLGSVSIEDCAAQHFTFGGGFSVNQRPLVIKEHHPANGASDLRVLIMGGIHGDEYSSISILFKWLALFSPDEVEGSFHWRFAPLVNPDGLLDGTQAKRQNANGVDLNRNFPSHDWNDSAAKYWQESTGSNPRRFPGDHAGSEPEVQWVVQQIEEFQPDVIVSVHAPYHLLDFDGPAEAPAKIGELYLHQLGVYPGSLGNFAGLNRRIPVVTLELPSAGIMPPAEQIDLMWHDLVAWLEREGRKAGLARL